MNNPLVQPAEKGIRKSKKSIYVSIYSSDTLKCNQTIIFPTERSMFNRKMILAGVSCLHGTHKHEFPRLCPSKTDISFRLLTHCGSHRNYIQGANFHYDLSLAFLRGRSFSKKFWLVFSYHIYCVIFYIILTFLQTSKCFLSNGTNYIHILASGPELQAV